MKRVSIQPRPDWQGIIQRQGFLYYQDYYDETVAYSFSSVEIERIESATQDLHDMCNEVVRYVVSKDLLSDFLIPKTYHDWIKWSWNKTKPSLYGRFDLGYDGSQIKLLEFNADTPTGLIETSVVQWYWLQDFNSKLDQFNLVHDKLLQRFQYLSEHLSHDVLYFSSIKEHMEDFMTVKYLQDIAEQAGIATDFIYVDDIHMHKRNFSDKNGRPIYNIFKLYPYEWMFQERFGPYLVENTENYNWLEPPYKSILSNKMLLKWLYKLFPNSPYVLPCEYGKPITETFVRKPVFSREGANIEVNFDGLVLESSDGNYGAEGFVFQEYFPIPTKDEMTTVIGSWVIGDQPAGIVMRESKNLITNNMSRFCPHYIEG